MKNYNTYIIAVFAFFTIFGIISIENDLPDKFSNSRAPWLDESLKNYVSKNIIDFDDPKPYSINEFRGEWYKVPVFTIWTIPFFKLIGVGYSQARILSLFTTILSLYVLYKIFSLGSVSKKNMLIIFVILLSNSTFFYFSRIGTYESFFLLLTLLSIFFTYFPSSKKRYFKVLSGAICSILYWLKPIGIIVFFICFVFLALIGLKKNNRGLKYFNYKSNIHFLSGFCFIQFLIYIFLNAYEKGLPRSMTLEGTKNIIQESYPSELYSFLINILNTLQTTEFFQMNILLVFVSLFNVGLWFLNNRVEKKNHNHLNILMLLWFLFPVVGFSWSIYKPTRLYYFMIPSLIYWSSYSFRISSIKIHNLDKIKKLLALFIFSIAINLVATSTFEIINSTFSINESIQRMVYSPLKIFLIFLSLVIFFDKYQYIIETQYKKFQFIFSSLIIISFLININELYIWQNTSNKNIIDYNKRIHKVLNDNEVTKIAGQWSPAFVFNLPKINSFPIIPGKYNEDIIEKLNIEYGIFERNELDSKIIDLYKKNKNYMVTKVDSFIIANQYIVDLFKISNVKL